MEQSVEHIIAGRKTFFIAPDLSLLPETYLEDYMIRGYETYIIGDDRYCPLKTKIEIIIETFVDSILFFYIDANISGIQWSAYIKELQETYGEKVLLGVLHSRRASEKEQTELEKYYLFDVGIKCGCITLEYQKANNFALIDRVMFANQACGRRKNVRAICDGSSRATFNKKGVTSRGNVLDVSLSHFSCMFDVSVDFRPAEIIKRIMLNVNGLLITTDAILLMTRETPKGILYIFGFLTSTGKQGLDADIAPRIMEKIYQMVTEKVKTLLWTRFNDARIMLQSERR